MGRDVSGITSAGDAATDLIHKSDLNGIVGKFACLSQFQRKKEERATGGRQPTKTRPESSPRVTPSML